MDGNRFDDIARRFAADSSRRSFLKRSVAAVAALTGMGGAAGASTARRPANPTPAPLRCPGQQFVSGGACVCPSGLTKCGPECCPDGAQCCDGACCYGTCYGEELCCPAPQIACEGRCLEAGLCCTDADCQTGWACGFVTPNVCTCVPTVSCDSSGRNCGPLTDDCGSPLDCGTCQAPNSCGGGSAPGICGCTVTSICDGRCGDIPTNCGTLLDCGGCQLPDTCGGGSAPDICGCTVTTTCDGKCGEVTSNCGTTLTCGMCQAPDTCGGGGTPNVCGCTVTTTCGDRCGDIPTNCNTTLSCGACPEPDPCGGACGICQTCSGTTCEQAKDGTNCGQDCSTGYCIGGRCSIMNTIQCSGDGGFGDPNPDAPCNTYQCVQTADGVTCVVTIANEGGVCTPLDECQRGICTQGQCAGTPVDCGACQECHEGSCRNNTGASCGSPDHKCVDGVCSHFPTGAPPSGVDVNSICSQLRCAGACCPGPSVSTCCASMDDCFLNDNGGFLSAYCCDPANKCGADCCWSGNSCAGGTTCRPDGMICADDPYCTQACCGGDGNPGTGTCCPAGTRCTGKSCTAIPSNGCNSQADCGPDGRCAGLVLDLQTNAVVTSGTCCLSAYAYVNPGPSTTAGQTVYSCCEAPLYVGYPDSANHCCSYADVGCANCQCSRVSVRRWGN